MTSFKKDLFWICLTCLILFCYQLNSIYYMSPDEARYVEVAREMWAQHQWVTPTLNGTAFLDKPALFYWVEMLIMQVFGLHPWSIRLLPVGFATLTTVMSYIAGRHLFDRKTGLLAAMIYMSSTFIFVAAHYTNMDLMLAALVSTALWLFLMERYLPAYVFAGLAFLTKGMIGLVLPMLVVGAWIVLYRRFSLLKRMQIPLGLLIILAINLPWYIAVQAQNHEFYYYFFYVQQFLRYTGDAYTFNMHNPVYYYVLLLFAGVLPWSFFVLQAVYHHVREAVTQFKQSEKITFILLWILLITLFFSIPASKTPGYIMPVFPALAMVLARYIAMRWDTVKQHVELRWVSVIYTLIFLSLSIYAASMGLHTKALNIPAHMLLPILVVVVINTVVLNGLAFAKVRSKLYFGVFFIAQCAFLWALVQPIALDRNSKSIQPIAEAILKNAAYRDPVIEYERYDYPLPLYLGHSVMVVSQWNDPNLIDADSWRRELAEDIIYKHQHQPELILPSDLPALWQQSPRVFVIVKMEDLAGLKRLVSPVYVMMTLPRRHTLLVTNSEALAAPNSADGVITRSWRDLKAVF